MKEYDFGNQREINKKAGELSQQRRIDAREAANKFGAAKENVDKLLGDEFPHVKEKVYQLVAAAFKMGEKGTEHQILLASLDTDVTNQHIVEIWRAKDELDRRIGEGDATTSAAPPGIIEPDTKDLLEAIVEQDHDPRDQLAAQIAETRKVIKGGHLRGLDQSREIEGMVEDHVLDADAQIGIGEKMRDLVVNTKSVSYNERDEEWIEGLIAHPKIPITPIIEVWDAINERANGEDNDQP